MFMSAVPMWFFVVWSLLCILLILNNEKANLRNCIAVVMAICILIYVVLGSDQTAVTVATNNDPSVNASTDADTSDTSNTSTDDSSTGITDAEMETMLTHDMDIPIDEKITLGNYDISLMSMFGEFLTAATKNNYQITSQDILDPGILEPDQSMEFMMIDEEGTTAYAYTYIQNTSDIRVTVDYAMMLEIVINPALLDNFKFLNFTKESTHDDFIAEWGEPEAYDSSTGEHVWSTEWGHIYVTFDSSGVVNSIDFYIHDDYMDRTKVKYDDDTIKTITEHVEEEEDAYESRSKVSDSDSAE